MKQFIGKLEISFEGSFKAVPKDEMAIIATLMSEECVVLWEDLKKKSTPSEMIARLLKKYPVIHGNFYILMEKFGDENGKIVDKDGFYILKGDYRL